MGKLVDWRQSALYKGVLLHRLGFNSAAQQPVSWMHAAEALGY